MGKFRYLSVLAAGFLACFSSRAEIFHVGTFNVENYLEQPTAARPRAKPAEARAKVRESIRAMNPDALALEEIGGLDALMELRASLKADGDYFPYWDMVSGSDTNIHVAILSKFPIEARHAYTNDTFLLDGRLFRVDRGFDEVTVRAPDLSFTIIAVHLKSRLRERRVNEAEERFEEARILRNIISQKLRSDPRARLIVLGDFNDTPDSPAMREIIGRGRLKLTDTRPAERNGDDAPAENPRYAPRRIVWTEYYGAEDSYSRIDYILLSPAMARYWLPAETHIVTLPNWGVASDHRPIVAGFDTHGATSP